MEMYGAFDDGGCVSVFREVQNLLLGKEQQQGSMVLVYGMQGVSYLFWNDANPAFQPTYGIGVLVILENLYTDHTGLF
ncbi:hypothetical protein VNO80_13322 [Phaseolus coccineus]|uniref:Uncharacterized protein n=1 Tax=Phaseolus coccineus TaxID=3886 RepID=A0AAN9N0R4_PHACN